MHVDYLIIGQGISGTFLSYYLSQAGSSFLVIDDDRSNTASKVAGGIINPVTGRRVVSTWMIEELMPFADNAYASIGNKIEKQVLQKKDLIAFPSTPEMQLAFDKRMEQQNTYVHSIEDGMNKMISVFNFPFNVLKISPAYLINMQVLLDGWRQRLFSVKKLLIEKFFEKELIINEHGISYKNISGGKIIFCNGVESFESRFWKNLPFVLNKGEALTLTIPTLNRDYMYKFGSLILSPWGEKEWWAGSGNELNFKDIEPTENFKRSTVSTLSHFLKQDFTVTGHLTSVRPATIERRPFVGVHPLFPSIAILNGMGAKGCSLAPWFASELADHLIKSTPINPLADVRRFERSLMKT